MTILTDTISNQESAYWSQNPFLTAEEAWFWFVQSYDAIHAGARVRKGYGSVVRPCEPVDIYTIVMRLFKQGFLHKEHLRVLTQYGQKLSAPNPRYQNQIHDSDLWYQAMDHLKSRMQHKGIVAQDRFAAS